MKSSERLSSLKARRQGGGFTLIELLVSCTVLILLAAILAKVMGGTSDLWIKQRGKGAAFESANVAFERLTRSLAQAVLNTNWGYNDPVHPSQYMRLSKLHLDLGGAADLLNDNSHVFPGDAVFFQAPLGKTVSGTPRILPSLLNSLGYFVHFGPRTDLPGIFGSRIHAKWRFRLYEWLQTTENLAVYSGTTGGSCEWFQTDAKALNSNSAVLAENIVALIFLAEYPLPGDPAKIKEEYIYDSRSSTSDATRNQLPPRIRVLMVALDEASAARLADKYGEAPPPVTPSEALFKDPDNFSDDVAQWESDLQKVVPRINYHLYTATVSIQNAKWSLNQ